MIAALRSLLFMLVFYGATVLFVLAALIAGLVHRRWLVAVANGWGHFYDWSTRVLLGIHIRIEGQLPQGPVLVALKHEAMYETLRAIPMFDTPAVVMKAELSRIPLWGWAARRYGIIPVDRDAGARAMREMLAAAKTAAGEGRSVLIFPEGTRVPPGETPPIRAGFAGLYKALGLPVVPIALDSGRLWTRGMTKHAGTITFRIGETIPTGLPRAEVEARVHRAINALNH
ncbi:1-acyl-sn-glycerol-3-phosphate acyltransferase [Sphingomonas zeicaulis]|uniref:lysophospholipid acyltransferase family protein n=1 Tax=Sphingomonas zeicaulis TaxID=1632740 RepID=UPI003D191081